MRVYPQALAGVAWFSMLNVAGQVLIFVLLTRFLLPADYGLFGMAMVFLGFAALLVEPIFGAALVQRREVGEPHLSSVFWLNLGIGTVLTLLFWTLAPAIARFFGEPLLPPLVRVLSLNFVLASLGIVPRALLQRRLALRQLAVIDVLATICAGGAAVAAAAFDLGVWSLAVQALGLSTILAILLAWAGHWSPRPLFSGAAVGELLGYTANLLGSHVAAYWARNADNLLIGKLLGTVALGSYTRAYSLMLVPVSQTTVAIGKVVFPALATVQGDRERCRQIFLRAVGLAAFLVFPVMLGLLATAESLVLALFGRPWAPIIPVLRIFCLVGVAQTLLQPLSWIYTSQGRTDWMLRWGLISSGAVVAAIAVGAWIGSIHSVAWSVLIAHVLLLYPSIAAAGRIIHMRVGEVTRKVAGVLGCSVLMALAAWVAGQVLPGSWSPAVRLLVQVLVGVVSYAACTNWFCSAALRDLRTLRGERRRRIPVHSPAAA